MPNGYREWRGFAPVYGLIVLYQHVPVCVAYVAAEKVRQLQKIFSKSHRIRQEEAESAEDDGRTTFCSMTFCLFMNEGNEELTIR